MKFRTLGLIIGLAMTGSSHAAVNSLQLTDTFDLGAFGAPTGYGDVFSVASQGTINHALTFTILTDLYAGSGVADIPLDLSYGSFTVEFTNITGLTAQIFDSNNDLYTSFMAPSGSDYLTLPASSFFSAGDYTLRIGGVATGTGSPAGLYTVAAVTAPVPEPETWGMLLAGVGLIGLRMRQRIRASGHVAIN